MRRQLPTGSRNGCGSCGSNRGHHRLESSGGGDSNGVGERDHLSGMEPQQEGRMLAQLEPIVESIPTSTSTNAVKGWLEVLRTRLESVKHVLQEASRHSSHFDIKQFSNSKKLVKEIKHLSETLSTAPVSCCVAPVHCGFRRHGAAARALQGDQ